MEARPLLRIRYGFLHPSSFPRVRGEEGGTRFSLSGLRPLIH